ncbi:MAG: DUF2436 domain-containing protein [Bacteroidales bacterium]|jgi:hypothetical protein|nr:DUF2436 domain-containing protein [Bacteroidales bacterium]
MKKIIFLLAFLLASFSFLSAQNVFQNQEPTFTQPGVCEPQGPIDADYTLKYITGDPTVALGTANASSSVRYTSGCIYFTQAQMYNYVGASLHQINAAVAPLTSMSGMQSYKIWIKTAMDGPVVYEQTVTPVLNTTYHWENYTLTTPYIITNAPLVVGFTATFLSNTFYPLACTNIPADTYKEGGFNYINASLNSNAHGVGASWMKYTAAGNLGIAALLTNAPTLPTNDLAASTIIQNDIKWIGNQNTFAVTVYNTGTAPQTGFTVQLLSATDAVLATSSAVTTTLAPGAFTNVSVNYAPTAAGNIVLKGKVVLAGDEVAGNNVTPPTTFKVYDMKPMGYCWAPPNYTSAYGASATAPFPTAGHSAIGYLAADMAQFVGKQLTAFEINLPTPPSGLGTCTIWIRNSTTGANLYSQVFTPVEGWQTITLTTPYPLTAANTFLGFTVEIPVFGAYPLSYSGNTANANGDHFGIFPSTGTPNWIKLSTLAPPVVGNMSIIGLVANAGANVTVTTAVNPAGAGNVTGGGTQPSGSNFTLTATATTGYTFQNWTPGNSTQNPLTLTNVTANATYTANFTATTPGDCNPPKNLTVAYSLECGKATLNWEAPDGKKGKILSNQTIAPEYPQVPINTSSQFAASGKPAKNSIQIKGVDEWLKWSGNLWDVIGNGSPNDYVVVARFTPADLAANDVLSGNIITHIRFIVGNTYSISSATLHIYEGGTSPTNPGSLVYQQPITQTLVDMGYTDVVLNEPFIIDPTKELWFGYRLVASYYNAGADYGPRVVNKGDLMYWNGGWSDLYVESGYTIQANWIIEAFIEAGSGTQYNVYRNGNLLKEGVYATKYVDNNFNPANPHEWSVKAVCETGGLSAPVSQSMPACSTQPPGDCNPAQNLSATYSSDCGTANLTWDPPVSKKAASYYFPEQSQLTGNVSTREGAQNNADKDSNPFHGQNVQSRAWNLEHAFNFSISNEGTAAVATDGQFIYVTRHNAATIYKYNMSGVLQTTFTIPGISALRSLTHDGTNFYGANATNQIWQLNFVNPAIMSTITLPSNVQARHCTYDPTANGGAGGFWVGNWTGSPQPDAIILVSKTGSVLQTIPLATHGVGSIYGTAYDNITPGGPYLWTIDAGGEPVTIKQIKIPEGTQTSTSINLESTGYAEPGSSGGGMFLAPTAFGTSAHLMSLVQNQQVHIWKFPCATCPAAPTALTVTPIGKTLTGTLTWTNPNTTHGGGTLPSITKIVILRNNAPFQEITTGVTPGAPMTLPITVPNAGEHTFTVYAVSTAGDGTKVSASGLFGDVCPITIRFGGMYNDSYSYYGNGGVEIFLDGVSKGNYMAGSLTSGSSGNYWKEVPVMLSSGEVQVKWLGGTFGGEVYVQIFDKDGDLVGGCGTSGCAAWPAGYTITTFPHGCGASFQYLVYRNGVHLITTKATNYSDKNYDSSTPHTWEVRVTCDDNILSPAISVTKPACGVVGTCNPATNLNIEYADDCGYAELTWTEPVGKQRVMQIPVPFVPGKDSGISREGNEASKALFTGESFTQTVSTPQFIIGDFCEISVTLSDINYGDSFAWEVKDQAGTTILGQSTPGSSGGTYSSVFSGIATFTAWQLGSFGDNSAKFTIIVNDEVVYEQKLLFTVGFTTSEPIECDLSPRYNIYRDGAPIAIKVKGTYYKDITYNPEEDHLWNVKVICDNGESAPASNNMFSCWASSGSCPPIKKLTYEQWEDCRVILNWDKPTGKAAVKAGDPLKPSYIPTLEDLAKDAQKEEIENETVLPNPFTLHDPDANRYPASNSIIDLGGERGDFLYGYRGGWADPIGHVKVPIANPTASTLQSPFTGASILGGEYHDGFFYCSDNNGPSPGTYPIYKVNHATGAFTVLANQPTLQYFNDMTYNCANQTMYALKNPASIYSINLTTGAATLVSNIAGAPTNGFITIACNQAGNMYGIELSSAGGPTSNFYSINLATNSCTLIGNTGVTAAFAQSMTFDRETNILYWASYSGAGAASVRIVNVSNGTTTSLATGTGEICGLYVPYIEGTPCPAVTNVIATVSAGTNNVNITWTAATGGPTGYEVHRNGTPLATVTSTSYTDNNVTPPGSYTYSVRALFPPANDCIPVSVSAPAVTVPEIFTGGCEGVVIGNGTASGYQIPLNTFYRYSYSQQIYDAADMTAMVGKELTAISFEYIHATPSPKNPVTVYLGITTKNTFAGTSDWVPVANLVQVFTGPLVFNNSSQWYTIYFNEPFKYNGGNLVVAVLNNEGNYTTPPGSNPTFRHHVATGAKTIHRYVDGDTPLNPAAPGTASATMTSRNNVRFIACTPFTYNVYRNGEFIDMVNNETYTDLTCDYTISNQYCVAVACDDGGESKLVCITTPICKPEPCAPVEELTAEYGLDCQFAKLTWKSPILPKIKSGSSSYLFPEISTEKSTAIELTETEKLAMENNTEVTGENRKATGTIIANPTTPNKVNPPRAPKGMVNVTLEAHNVWGDGTGFQLLLDETATQYGVTIPATGAAVGSFGGTTCAVPATLWNVFSHLIPVNAVSVCTTTAIVFEGSVTIQIPAGTYDWGIANPCPGDRIWRVGAGGGPETSGARDNYVFQDGLNYNFHVQLYLSTGNDGVVITTEPAGDPCPAVTNVTATVVPGTAQVKINWNPAPGGPINNQVLRDNAVIATLGASANTYTDATATQGMHTYCVKAVFPPANDCVPVSVCAPPVNVPEIFGEGCEGKVVLSGNGTTSVSTSPTYTLYGCSYNQLIFTEAELGLSPGQAISAIAFNYVSPDGRPPFPIAIFMGHTTKNEFAAATAAEFVPFSQLELVYQKPTTLTAANTWLNFQLDAPFTYEGGNLLVAVHANPGNPGWFSSNYFGGNTGTYKNIRTYQDPYFAPGAMGSSFARDNTRANIRFIVCEDIKEYNIYRDGLLIAANYKGNEYIDDIVNGMNPKNEHCWEVKYVRAGEHSLECPEGVEVCLEKCAEDICTPTESTIGTGTTYYYDPLPGWYGWSRNIILLQANEINGAGAIDRLAFNIYQAQASLRPMKIYLMHTNSTTLDPQYVWNTIKAQATLVYDAQTNFPTAGTTVWQFFDLSALNTFVYNGTQNLLVLVEGQGCTTSGGCAAQAYYTVKTASHWYSRADINPPNDAGLAGTRNDNRPNIKISIDCPPQEVDMAATKIQLCPNMVKTQSEYDVEVTVRNLGENDATDYVVEVRTYPEMEILAATTNVPTLIPGASATVSLPVIFNKVGEYDIRGRVEIADDFNPLNNQTASLKLTVRPKDDDEIVEVPCPANVGAPLNTIPFNFYYNQSVVQSIYTEAELGIAGGYIKNITWFYQNAAPEQDRPVKVWMRTTELNTLAAAWLPYDSFILVYDGSIKVPAGESEVTLALSTPYLYLGGNLVIMTERIYNTPYVNNVLALTTTVTPTSRTRLAYGDTQFTPSNPGSASYNVLLNAISNIRLTVNVPAHGKIMGTASCEGLPVEGVKIVINEMQGASKITDADGNYYFGFVPPGTYNMTATKFMYFDEYAGPITVVNNKTEIVNFENACLLPNYSVWGAVANAEGELLEGAKVELKGYENYVTTTAYNGSFDFLNVYAPKEYTITITLKGYQTYTAPVDVTGHTNLGTIVLLEVPFPSKDVVAVEIDPFVEITWEGPAPGGGATPHTYILDDGSSENGWRINPSADASLGNQFTVNEEGYLTSIDVFGDDFPSGGLARTVTIDIYDESRQLVGTSAPFSIPLGAWVNVPLDDIPYSGTFYAMVHWPPTTGDTYYLGFDENGPNAYNNLDWYRNSAGTWTLIHIAASADPGVFLIRANAMVEGKKTAYGSQVPEYEDINVTETVSMSNNITVAGDPPAVVVEKGGATRGVTGYRLWRLTPGQEETPNAWTTLTNLPVPVSQYTDVTWPTATMGNYKWAVRTCYHGGVESDPAFSNILYKNIEVIFTIDITTNSGDSPAGAWVELLNAGKSYTSFSTSTGITFPAVLCGTYNLTITFAGYQTYTASVAITGTGSHQAMLIEIINDPTDAIATPDECNVLFKWNHEAEKSFLGFTVYLNDEIVKSGIQVKEYLFTNLATGDYTAGVVANYGSGNSSVATANFSVNCVSVHEIEEGNYEIYPNPTMDRIYVHRASDTPALIEIYDAMGKFIHKVETSEVKYELNVISYSAGTYFIRVTEGSNTGVKSFVKQ